MAFLGTAWKPAQACRRDSVSPATRAHTGLVTPTQTPVEAVLWLRAVREVSPSPPIQRGLQSGKDPHSLQLQGARASSAKTRGFHTQLDEGPETP